MPEAAGLWYEWTGNPAGEALLLSSGLGGSANYWAPNLAALGEHYHVLRYDHRGTGRSGPLPPGGTSVEAMALDVRDLLDALGVERAHFIGHALGGMIGMETALLCGDRIGKLVAVNAWSKLDPHTARCFDVRLDLLRASGPAAYLRAQPIFLYPAAWISRHDVELEEEAAHQLAAFPPVETVEKRIAAVRGYQTALQGLIAADTLFLASGDDMLVPAARSADLAAMCVRSSLKTPSLKTMAWGGHACNVTDPDTFNPLILDFLGS